MNDHWRRAADALGRGDLAVAEAACDALMAGGARAEGLFLLAHVRSAQGRAGEAVDLLQQSEAAHPCNPAVTHALGVLLRGLGRIEDAAAAWLRTVALRPDHRDAWLDLAGALEEMSGPGPARRVLAQALAECPDDAGLMFAEAELLQRWGCDAEARDSYGRLLAAHAGHALALANMGLLEARTGDAAGAEASLRRAAAVAEAGGDAAVLARIRYKLANLLLSQERWAEGFTEYEARRQLPEAPSLDWPMPEWTGTEPKGCRVLLWNDQGLGDAIQFLRFVPRAAARGYRVVVALRRDLVGLAATVPGVVAAIALEDAVPEVDAHAPLSSLPHRLGIGDGPVWPGAPYVSPGGRSVPLPPARGRRAGLVWAGNSAQGNDRHRSLGLVNLAPLMVLEGVHWHSLQLGAGTTQLAAMPWGGTVDDLSPLIGDFADTAAILERLDLLVTVDTSVAHLAGALGRPAWVLLPAVGTDWRYGRGGDTTPWYPSLRLFRQGAAGDWAEVLGRLGEALEAWLGD